MIVKTIPDDHHEVEHEVLFPDGPIPAGWYPTTSIGGHFHGAYLEEDLEVGEKAEITVDLSMGSEAGLRHAHILVVEATEHVEPESGDDGESDSEIEEDGGLRYEEELRCATSAIEVKACGRHGPLELKQANRNGVPVGIVSGYLATWDRDTGGRFGVPDQFVRGAFLESLADHRARGNRQIRLKDNHDTVIGGFPIETVFEDEIGLRGIGEINLETQTGREAWSLAKQGVLTDFSVGYIPLDDKIESRVRRIFRVDLRETSIVDEPANQRARILDVKGRQRPNGFVDVEMAKEITARVLEAKLHETGMFSRSASRCLAARLATTEVHVEVDVKSVEDAPEANEGVRYDPKTLSATLQGLKDLRAALRRD